MGRFGIIAETNSKKGGKMKRVALLIPVVLSFTIMSILSSPSRAGLFGTKMETDHFVIMERRESG